MGQATFSILLKAHRSSFEGLRRNGGAVEIIGVISVRLSLPKYEPVEESRVFQQNLFL